MKKGSRRKNLFYTIVVVLIGLALLGGGFVLERKEGVANIGLYRYNAGCEAVETGDLEKAAELFFEVGIHTEDTKLRARALHNLATIEWAMNGSAEAIILTYQHALRESPNFGKAAFNLELLYDLLWQMELENQGIGEGQGEGEEGGTSGDI